MSERTALYRFYGEDDVLLYVGITNELGQRWSNHARLKPWWPEVVRQEAIWLPTREEAAAAEVTAIKSETPRYNIAHAVVPLTPEQIRTLNALDLAHEAWMAARQDADAAKAEFFEACADAVGDGHAPDEIAARQKARKTPEQIDAKFTFSAAYIRRMVRNIGVAALPGGPKRKQPSSE